MTAKRNNVHGQRIMKVSNSKCVGKTSFLLTYFTEGTDENKEDVGGHHQNTPLYLAAVTCTEGAKQYKDRKQWRKRET